MNSVRIFRKYFTHTVGYPINDPIFYKEFTPFQGFPISTYIYPSEGRPLVPRLISSGGKMERMPMTCAMGLALECFQWIIPTKGMIF